MTKVATLTRKALSRAPERGPRSLPAGQIGLATLLERSERGWRVRSWGRELEVSIDGSVDRKLLEQCFEGDTRVVVETDGRGATIVGVLLTSPALTIGPDGDVKAKVRRFVIEASDEAMLKTRRAMVRLTATELEHYADEVKTRARNAVRILGAIIRLN